ncbi:MAG: hypothetical protein QM796_17795 [Chthoniobacteraceae bacterium]
MDDEKKCPECGTRLEDGTADGLCPACLLQRGFATQTFDRMQETNFVPPTPEELAPLFPQLEIIEAPWTRRHGRGLQGPPARA